MGKIGVAFRAFFRALGDADFARRLEPLLDGQSTTATLPEPTAAIKGGPAVKPVPSAKPTAPSTPAVKTPAAPARSDALTLLAVLQREARFVDFIKESLGDYNDAQIGTAARDVHRDCAAAVERLFGLVPLVDDAEGASIELPAGYDAARYRLTGNVAGQPPFRGSLCHHGWRATRQALPQWSGTPEAALIIAPAEVEVR